MSDLQRVLAALDQYRLPSGHVLPCAADAARVIRELAADFDKYADHTHTCEAVSGGPYVPEWCNCGYPERVEKWRLEP